MTEEPTVFGMKIKSATMITCHVEDKLLSKAKEIAKAKKKRIEDIMSSILEKGLEKLIKDTGQ